MASIHLDCSFGLGGDMFLAALCGFGVDVAVLESMMRDAGVDVRVSLGTVTRAGEAGHVLAVEPGAVQPLRHLPQINEIIERLDVSEAVRKKSLAAFLRLGHAEAAVHEVDISQIHFHEVGAVDTLVDVVGAFWAMERLDVSRVECTALPWFSGTVTCSHGVLDLPAPATRMLLDGKPTYETDFTQEIITPTGALILDQVVEQFGVDAPLDPEKTSLAYGGYDTGGGLRVVLVG